MISAMDDEVKEVFSGLRVTLLDKEEHHASLIRNAAAACGIRNVNTDRDPKAVLQALLNRDASNILLLHWQVPLEDGINVCRMIRNRRMFPRPFLPIVFVSAHATRDHVVRARDAGADEFLVSPFSVSGFYKRIYSVIYDRRGFVDVPGYFGPCRRRGAMAEWLGTNRRTEGTSLIDPVSGELYIA